MSYFRAGADKDLRLPYFFFLLKTSFINMVCCNLNLLTLPFGQTNLPLYNIINIWQKKI